MQRPANQNASEHRSAERRRYPRAYLGLPVRLHFADEPCGVTLELVDISLGGAYFRTSGTPPRRGQWLAFGFVTSERQVCAARGPAVRIDDSGFAVALDSVNSALRAFLLELMSHMQRAA